MYTNYLDFNALQNIKEHKYRPGVYTSLDKILDPFWLNITEYIPKKVAPNLITLVGLFFIFAQTISTTYFNASLKGILEPSACFFSAFCLIVYQTLDAIDGKQARRIGRSSPLGQLFDHGCDSIAVACLNYTLLSLMGVGKEPVKCLVFFLGTTSAFYIANWSEYHTRILPTSCGEIGVTEIEFFFAGCCLLTAFFGDRLWRLNLCFY